MSHFLGAVVVPAIIDGYNEAPGEWPLEEYLAEALEPFDEARSVMPQPMTRKDEAEAIAGAREYYAKHPEYADQALTPRLMEQWNGGRWLLINDELRGFEIHNTRARWDWYVLGGRWEDAVRERQGETVAVAIERAKAQLAALLQDPESEVLSPRTLVISNRTTGYRWHELGRMGWWGISTGDDTARVWLARYIQALEGQPPESRMYYVDFHI